MARLKKTGSKVKDGNIEAAIRNFNSSLKKSGKLEEYKERLYYEKPSEKRNRLLNY